MKNYLVFVFGIAFVILTQSCTTVYNIGTDGTSKQTAYVQDDLYDEQVVFASKPKKQKKSDYYAPAEDDGIVIEEEEGVSKQTFLNSRSVYSNYDSGYADGFRNGAFSNMAWNNWYSNPYVSFGYSPYRAGLNFVIGAGSLYNSYLFMNPYSFYSPYYSPFAYAGIDPFFDPFYNPLFNRYYTGFGVYRGGLIGPYYNPYSNPFVYLGGSSGYYGATGYSYSNNEPVRRVVRGPRDDYGSNRYNDSYSAGGGRNANNQYNNSYNNQVQTVSPNQQRDVVQEYQRMQQRRNSNIEYTRPSNNDSFYQNRSSNFGSGGGYSGGGGGGGSYSGGGSRGPR